MIANKKKLPQDPVEKLFNTFAIIQLASMSEVIQTLQAAMEFKKSHSEVRLLLICQERSARPVEFKLREVFEQIIYLNYQDIFCPQLPSKSINLEGAKYNIERILDSINSFDIDVAINLDYSKMAGYFASLIKSQHKLGPIRNQHNELKLSDRWTQYLYLNTINNRHAPFNLVDVFKGVLGARHNSYNKNHRRLKNKKIIIHPFSQQEKNKWHLGKWAEVIYQVLKNHSDVSIVVVGDSSQCKKAEILLANTILEKFKQRIVDLVGKRSLEKTYDEFRQACLFIGHNSVEGHLASLFNVQTLTVNLGTTHPHETIPYGMANYSITSRIGCFPCAALEPCQDFPCHKDISHNVLSVAIDLLLAGEEICLEKLQQKTALIFLDKIDIYRTHIDQNFGLFLVNCLHDDSTMVDIFRGFYRILWSLVLADQELTMPFPEISERRAKQLGNYCTGLGYLCELNKFGRTYASYIIEEMESDTPQVAKIRKYSNKLLEVDQFSVQLKAIYPHLSPLVDYYHISKANVPGNNVKEIAEFSLVTYHEALNAAEAMRELIIATLKNSGYEQVLKNIARKLEVSGEKR